MHETEVRTNFRSVQTFRPSVVEVTSVASRQNRQTTLTGKTSLAGLVTGKPVFIVSHIFLLVLWKLVSANPKG